MSTTDLPSKNDLDKFLNNLSGNELFLLLLFFWMFETKNQEDRSD